MHKNKVTLMNARSILIFMIVTLIGCSTIPEKQIEEIKLFDSEMVAPPYSEISVCECYGFAGLFKMPTYDKAIREAKIEAVKKGGDAIILLYTVRAVDLPSGLDLTEISARLVLKEKDANKLVNHINENMAEDQLVWFFAIAKLKR